MRMNGFMLASLVARECDIELICHLACRDRNLIATQGLLLGADALGIRNVLAITGDPSKLGDYPDATSVYDFNSFKLVELLGKLNSGTSLSGQPLGKPTRFNVGVAYNPNVRNIDVEVKAPGEKGRARRPVRHDPGGLRRCRPSAGPSTPPSRWASRSSPASTRWSRTATPSTCTTSSPA